MAANLSNKVNLEYINSKLKDCPDVVQKRVYIENSHESYFIYIRELIDKDIIQRDFVRPIISMDFKQLSDPENIQTIPCIDAQVEYDSDIVIDNILNGKTVFISKDIDFAITCEITDFEKRAIDEPITEKNTKGPHEGFVEVLDVNLSILRRKIKNNNLKFKNTTLGQQSKQNITIAYIEGIADNKIVESLYKKIKEIEIDGLPAIGYVEQILIEHPYSLFPQFLSTERPDRAMGALLEGRIIILQEGTPVVLIAPINFISFFQALDDYSTAWIHGSFLRLVRIVAVLLAVILPALYIAVTTFHYYAVPLKLLVPLAESRSKVPFPPIIEVLILEAIVEIIREASVRLPTYIGTSIGVFASLVIGQAAVEAGIVSNVLIIIVATSAVASYAVPSLDMALAIRILRFVFIMAASVFGLIGIVICIGFTLVHLSSMDSLGQPYLGPYTPMTLKDFKDTLIRFPIKSMRKRPSVTKTTNKDRGKINGWEK